MDISKNLKTHPLLIGIFLLLPVIFLLLGKPRWQYFPLYSLFFLTAGLLLFYRFGVLNTGKGAFRFYLFSAGALLLLFLLTSVVFPKMKIPKPEGPFQVGTSIYLLEDSTRLETYTVDPQDYRQIAYQVWYPAKEIQGFQKAKWISSGTALTRTLAKSFGFPAFLLDHTADIYGNAYFEAPVHENAVPYPVVVISHGWQGFRELHTDFAETLASYGFIAVSIDHTYGAQAVPLKNGQMAFLKKEALPSRVSEEAFESASEILMKTYGEDVLSVLDDLSRRQALGESPFASMNLASVGVLGHSTGGGGDVYAASKDSRIKALLGLDAWLEPLGNDLLKKGLSIPSVFVRSSQWSLGPNNRFLKLLLEPSPDAFLYDMKDTNHVDFSMAYMYSPLSPYIGFSGKLGPKKSSEIQKSMILSFFSEHLDTAAETPYSPFQNVVDRYPEIQPVPADSLPEPTNP